MADDRQVHTEQYVRPAAMCGKPRGRDSVLQYNTTTYNICLESQTATFTAHCNDNRVFGHGFDASLEDFTNYITELAARKPAPVEYYDTNTADQTHCIQALAPAPAPGPKDGTTVVPRDPLVGNQPPKPQWCTAISLFPVKEAPKRLTTAVVLDFLKTLAVVPGRADANECRIEILTREAKPKVIGTGCIAGAREYYPGAPFECPEEVMAVQ